ncbi:hypothetical protein [Streptomyces sp. NBC_00989]|uniref:hypothetical protein n=1 Tax=Streptomyces sp. NBC_00989 TaxID=2903705 RepID=UPI002F90B6C9|nr:hypothetical protein OG714_54370 [Streptomyces sp. NBC_00989]
MIHTVTSEPDGIRLLGSGLPHTRIPGCPEPELVQPLKLRGEVLGVVGYFCGPAAHPLFPAPEQVDRLSAEVLVLPRSERWREAVTTAVLGNWCEPLLRTGYLPTTALGALKAEARTLHRQLVPVWRHGTRAGRVLSLDADLGGLSLYDLVAPDVDLLARTEEGVYADERLNTVLRGLDPAERAVVFAYAEGDGTTWTEAATHVVGAAAPDALGERVRRKVKRLAAEQRRRAAQRYPGPPAP